MIKCSNDRMVDPSICRNTISYFPFRLMSFYYSTVDNSLCRFVNCPLVEFRWSIFDLSIDRLSIGRLSTLSIVANFSLRSRQQFPVNLAVSNRLYPLFYIYIYIYTLIPTYTGRLHIINQFFHANTSHLSLLTSCSPITLCDPGAIQNRNHFPLSVQLVQ